MRDSRTKSVVLPSVFSGWKEIATYLGKGVRTVQRYERELALPVRRPAGKPRGSVVATKAELDAWVSASPIREAFKLSAPQPSSGYQSAAAAVYAGLAEMTRLREQMATLRGELRQSISALRSSVWGVQTEMGRRWEQNPLSLTELQHHTRSEQMALLFDAMIRRKAS